MVEVGQPAPEFTLPDQSGSAARLSGLRESPSSSTSIPRMIRRFHPCRNCL